MHGPRRPSSRHTSSANPQPTPPGNSNSPTADRSGPRPSPPKPPASPSFLPRFTIGGMMLVTLVFCCIASAGYYLARSLQGGQNARLAFTLFTLASPVVLMVLVSLVYHGVHRGRRRR